MGTPPLQRLFHRGPLCELLSLKPKTNVSCSFAVELSSGKIQNADSCMQRMPTGRDRPQPGCNFDKLHHFGERAAAVGCSYKLPAKRARSPRHLAAPIFRASGASTPPLPSGRAHIHPLPSTAPYLSETTQEWHTTRRCTDETKCHGWHSVGWEHCHCSTGCWQGIVLS